MAKNTNITPEKLAQVAAMVQAQKAKADAQKSKATTKTIAPAVKAAKVVNQKALDEAAAAKAAERDARKTARDQERASKKAELEAKRAVKQAERQAIKDAKAAERGAKAPAWQRKIDRLAANLPEATENITSLAELITSFDDLELTNALAYVEYERRVRAIKATAQAKDSVALNVGDKVFIRNCNARKFIGQEGIVTLVRRVRAFVEVDGFDTKAYVWTTDVDVLEPANAEELGNNILDGEEVNEDEVETLDTDSSEETEATAEAV